MKLALFSAIVAASGFTIAPFALSETYRTEISASYGETDSDYYSGDNYTVGLSGKLYFSPVDTAGLPLAEAAFLQKASSFSVSLSNSEYEYEGDNQDAYLRGANLTYFVPNSIFFVGAGITENKWTYEYRFSDETDFIKGSTDWASRWNAAVGIAPIDGLQVWSDFFEDTDVSEHWNLNAKYVKPLAGERAFGVEVRYGDYRESDSHSINVSADYYFTHRFSVGAGAGQAWSDESDVEDQTTYNIHARHFLTENASVELSYSDYDYSTGWQLGGTVRF
ncbi:MAG: putative porin [Pseudomonadota bacterium]|nr:putative porin [Pseudomonadota bacterium]